MERPPEAGGKAVLTAEEAAVFVQGLAATNWDDRSNPEGAFGLDTDVEHGYNGFWFSGTPPDGPEDRPLAERCLMGFNSGPPMIPSAYNNSVRIIKMDGRPRLPPGIRQWIGDSRGRWEGDTLVVETINFLRETHFEGSSANLQLVERFTRVGPGELSYEFTVSDPNMWTRPWTALIPMTKTDGRIFEYACHEGNYGMVNMLASARAKE